MEGICVNFLDPSQFFRFIKGRCHGNQFCGKITYPTLHLSLWHSETEWDIITSVCALTALISCKNFVNFGPVTPEKTGLICELFVRHGKKLVYLVEYLRIPYESGLCADDRPVPHFPICQGMLRWQSMLGKCHECRLKALAFFALFLENELQYHCLNVCINSGDNVATSCKNLVNCRVTPEITELICVPVFGEN